MAVCVREGTFQCWNVLKQQQKTWIQTNYLLHEGCVIQELREASVKGSRLEMTVSAKEILHMFKKRLADWNAFTGF